MMPFAKPSKVIRLAQNVTTRFAHAAASKVSADALLAKALSIQRIKTWKDVHAINDIQLQKMIF